MIALFCRIGFLKRQENRKTKEHVSMPAGPEARESPGFFDLTAFSSEVLIFFCTVVQCWQSNAKAKLRQVRSVTNSKTNVNEHVPVQKIVLTQSYDARVLPAASYLDAGRRIKDSGRPVDISWQKAKSTRNCGARLRLAPIIDDSMEGKVYRSRKSITAWKTIKVYRSPKIHYCMEDKVYRSPTIDDCMEDKVYRSPTIDDCTEVKVYRSPTIDDCTEGKGYHQQSVTALKAWVINHQLSMTALKARAIDHWQSMIALKARAINHRQSMTASKARVIDHQQSIPARKARSNIYSPASKARVIDHRQSITASKARVFVHRHRLLHGKQGQKYIHLGQIKGTCTLHKEAHWLWAKKKNCLEWSSHKVYSKFWAQGFNWG